MVSRGEQDHVIIAMFLVLSMASSALGATTLFNVISYGAVGNGRADDSQAFLRAWKAGCQSQAKSTPVIYIPPKRTFLLRPLSFNGPCKSPRIYVLLSGNLVAPVKSAFSGARQKDAWIIFYNVNGLVLKGKGVIDGRGSSWWPTIPCFDDPAHGVNCKGPVGMIFRRCNGLRLDGFSKINGPGRHIVVMSTKDAVLSNLRIIAPGDSPNTDAIGISGSTQVQVRNSFIATGRYVTNTNIGWRYTCNEILSEWHTVENGQSLDGDDCIAVSAGSSNVEISGITCGPGHGISIGSLGGGGFDVVENVRVRNCTLTKTLTGVRIKTLQGGKGYARKISFSGIRFVEVNNPIEIEQFYCPLRVNCQNYTSAVAVSDVSFTAISGTSTAEKVINLSCSQTNGCRNIVLDRVYIKPAAPAKKVYATCFNAHGKAAHTKPAVNCLMR